MKLALSTTHGKIIAISAISAALLVLVGSLAYHNATPKPKRVTEPLSIAYGVDDPAFLRDLEVHMSAPIVGNNHIELFQNGEEIQPAQLDAMREARHHIHIETFQFVDGDLTREILDILTGKLEDGVEVRLILDFAGSALADFAALSDLADAGATVVRWRKPSWYQLGRLNHRTHRKLLIIDGSVGFTGGANLTDNWLGHPRDGNYRDNFYRVEGPVVAWLQAAFMDNLVAATGQPLFGDDYFPVLEDADGMHAQVVLSSPREGRHRMRKMKLMAFAAARDHIRIGTPYFYPDPGILDALVDARERGVDVDIITPGEPIDKQFVRKASKSHWGGLLEAGIRFNEYDKAMYHAKLMIVDDYWVSVGSTNIDNRSFRINDEANLNIFDRDFAQKMIGVFNADLEHTTLYDLERWQSRGWITRLRGWLGRVLGPHL